MFLLFYTKQPYEIGQIAGVGLAQSTQAASVAAVDEGLGILNTNPAS